MKKIASLFQRDYEGTRLVVPEVVPGAEWVHAGEGVATRKWDGTCIRLRPDAPGSPQWDCHARREVGKGKTPPPNYEPVSMDPVTGKVVGWEPAAQSPFLKYIEEALDSFDGPMPAGTYELCGPKINGNPERFDKHVLIRHGADLLPSAPRDFDGIRDYLRTADIEGIVWHRGNGDMVKIKARDFGWKR